ncbi:MAG: carbohydrate kinase family protein [Candidatus Magasanikbacteria bacterium]
MFDLITIGDATLDTFLVLDKARLTYGKNKRAEELCLQYGEKIAIEHSVHSLGGNATNVAVGVKRLGYKTALVTELGDDLNGDVILDELKEKGVNTKYIKIHKNAETRTSIILSYRGERTILSHHIKRNYTFPKNLQTKWIYYTSLAEGFEKIQENLVVYLTKHPEVKLACNPGSYQLSVGKEHIKKLFPHIEILFVNLEEAGVLLGKKYKPKKALKLLQKMGVKTPVITDGTKGSYVFDGAKYYFMPIYPIKALERTGAGDAFASGFLSAILAKKTIPEALTWGTANSGGVILEMGAQKGLLTKSVLLKTLKKYPQYIPKKI